MSKQLKKPLYEGKHLEQQWINCFYSTHDLCCGCEDPLLHFLIICNKKGNAPKPEDDIKNIKCLITGEEDDTEDVFGPGELEELFKEEDGGTEDDPSTTG